jgi:lysozyme
MIELYRLIKRFEGCRLVPYLCPAGVWTCGWGSTGPDVMPGQSWTQEYADRRMEQDAIKFARGAIALCPTIIGTAHAAIADFAYNLGLGNLRTSTLRKRINAGDTAGAVAELKKWTRGGGRVLPGLVARRAAEAALL